MTRPDNEAQDQDKATEVHDTCFLCKKNVQIIAFLGSPRGNFISIFMLLVNCGVETMRLITVL